jgi:protein phosphatase PTC7
LIVVADGVGGWEQHGIDSGKFSKQLVKDIKKNNDENAYKQLKQILIESVKSNKNIGSSTVVMAKFDNIRENILKTTNLGDSGYLILRPDKNTPGKLKTIFRSKS